MSLNPLALSLSLFFVIFTPPVRRNISALTTDLILSFPEQQLYPRPPEPHEIKKNKADTNDKSRKSIYTTNVRNWGFAPGCGCGSGEETGGGGGEGVVVKGLTSFNDATFLLIMRTIMLIADDDDSASICAAAKRGEQWRILFYQRFPRPVSNYLSRLGSIVKASNDEELKYINRSWYLHTHGVRVSDLWVPWRTIQIVCDM